jgi:hypothetical protein
MPIGAASGLNGGSVSGKMNLPSGLNEKLKMIFKALFDLCFDKTVVSLLISSNNSVI